MKIIDENDYCKNLTLSEYSHLIYLFILKLILLSSTKTSPKPECLINNYLLVQLQIRLGGYT